MQTKPQFFPGRKFGRKIMVVLRGFSCWKMWPKVDVELMFWCSAYFWISDLLNLLEWETPWKTWFRAWTCWTCLRGHSYRDYRASWHCHAALPQYCSCCQHRMWWSPAPETSDFTFPWFEGISMHDVHMMHGLHFFWMVYFLTSMIPWFNPGFSDGFHGPWASMFHQAAPRVNSTR